MTAPVDDAVAEYFRQVAVDYLRESGHGDLTELAWDVDVAAVLALPETEWDSEIHEQLDAMIDAEE